MLTSDSFVLEVYYAIDVDKDATWICFNFLGYNYNFETLADNASGWAQYCSTSFKNNVE